MNDDDVDAVDEDDDDTNDDDSDDDDVADTADRQADNGGGNDKVITVLTSGPHLAGKQVHTQSDL